MSPVEARHARALRDGQDTISVTGNVLRDYLTDLFPILEIGTSAKMLSIVPLMNGGGLFETGAGGSAPKHVQQFWRRATCAGIRWASSWRWPPRSNTSDARRGNARRKVLAETLDQANAKFLENDKSPREGRRDRQPRQPLLPRAVLGAGAGGADRRRRAPGRFSSSPETLRERDQDRRRAHAAQGKPVDLGGYYRPDHGRPPPAMRPSATFNAIVDGMSH